MIFLFGRIRLKTKNQVATTDSSVGRAGDCRSDEKSDISRSLVQIRLGGLVLRNPELSISVNISSLRDPSPALASCRPAKELVEVVLQNLDFAVPPHEIRELVLHRRDSSVGRASD